MSKPTSYYDWEATFKSKTKSKSLRGLPKKENYGLNSIDIDQDLFRSYVRFWTKKHIPSKND
jgi:hypothetical protein